jgi:hypothetical protein
MVVMARTHTHPTCPTCADDLDGVDYVRHGYAETVWVCERCDARYSPADLAEAAEQAEAEADAPELAATRGLEDVDGWATVVGGEVVEVFGTRTQAADLAEWLVSQGGALVATVQPYSPEGIYLPDDHGC